MPELKYIARTSGEGTQNSSTLADDSTQALGKEPYSQGWMTTSEPEAGFDQLGGH